MTDDERLIAAAQDLVDGEGTFAALAAALRPCADRGDLERTLGLTDPAIEALCIEAEVVLALAAALAYYARFDGDAERWHARRTAARLRGAIDEDLRVVLEGML